MALLVGSVEPRTIELTPSASRLTNSLRDIGYEFVTAVADIVDNSLSAGAARVDVLINFRGADSSVFIVDDGMGMTSQGLDEALRFGSRRSYSHNELGRYGLGLKTASLSQCRRLSVVSRRAPSRRRLNTRVLDLDHVALVDAWQVTDQASPLVTQYAEAALASGPGTVVAWEGLDRVLPERNPSGGWARRRLESLEKKTVAYLAMVFHRFLEGAGGVRISVNGSRVKPWDPFAQDESETVPLPPSVFEVEIGGVTGSVRFRPFVLPPRNVFSSQEAFEHFSGPQKWNRQQGLYIYRAGRLIQGGGWCGIRGIDEHTKLARASLEFGTELDEVLQTNVAKMRVAIPQVLAQQLERPIKELCQFAESAYREAAADRSEEQRSPTSAVGRELHSVGTALKAGAMAADEYASLSRIMLVVRSEDSELAAALGW